MNSQTTWSNLYLRTRFLNFTLKGNLSTPQNISLYFCPFSPIHSISNIFLFRSRKMRLGPYLAFFFFTVAFCFLNLGHSYTCASQGLILDLLATSLGALAPLQGHASQLYMGHTPRPLAQIGNNLNFACGLFFLFHVLFLCVLKPSFPRAKIDESHHFLLSWCYRVFYSADDRLSHTCEHADKQDGAYKSFITG